MLSRPVKANPEAQWERSKYRDNPEPQSYAAKPGVGSCISGSRASRYPSSISSTVGVSSLMRYLSFVLSANTGMAITTATVRTVVSRRLISATSFSLATPTGLLLQSIEAGGDELAMNRGRIASLFIKRRRIWNSRKFACSAFSEALS
jgi:hypothetical protein